MVILSQQRWWSILIIISTKEKEYVHKEFEDIKHLKHDIQVGDFVSGNCVIERKTVRDLYHSLDGERLEKQLMMLDAYQEDFPNQRVILLIEGNNIHGQHVSMGTLLAKIIKKHKVTIVRTRDLRETKKFIIQLDDNKNDSILRNVRKYKTKTTLREQKIFFLSGLPTIGRKRAEKIVDEYESLMEFFKKVKNEKIKKVLY